MERFQKSMTIAEAMQVDREKTVPVLLNAGMHCLGCPMSTSESLEDACATHGIDIDALIGELENAVA